MSARKPKGYKLEESYRGFCLTEHRAEALGGWLNTYYHAYRGSDGFGLEDSFTESQEAKGYHIAFMKRIVDAFVDICAGDSHLDDVARDIACGEPIDEAFAYHGKIPPASPDRVKEGGEGR